VQIAAIQIPPGSAVVDEFADFLTETAAEIQQFPAGADAGED